jgi:hypothetical protein
LKDGRKGNTFMAIIALVSAIIASGQDWGFALTQG